MGDSADEHCGHGDFDHGEGDVHSGFVVSHEAPMADHPTEGALDERLYNVAKSQFRQSEMAWVDCQEAGLGR